jgi:hypothetical protein
MNDHLICILLYGDFPELAKRCIEGLITHTAGTSLHGCVKIGMNSVCEETRQYVFARAVDFDWHVVDSPENIKKYPMMRRLFYDSGTTIRAKQYTIWFDDDSYVCDSRWLSAVYVGLGKADMVGSLYEKKLLSDQPRWVTAQPWYSGKDVSSGHVVRFCTGGWWAIKSSILDRFDWPTKELLHRGGDVMLGELCRQQNLKLLHNNSFVKINADPAGNESAAQRRGYDDLPIGWKLKE